MDAPHHGALVAVATLGSALDANLCRMALREGGIESWLSTENLANIAPPLGLTLGVDVLVHPEDASAARELLDALQAGAAELSDDRVR